MVSFILCSFLFLLPPQEFKRFAKPQVPRNMTIPNYKVKVWTLQIAVGSVRRKHYPLPIKIAKWRFALGNMKSPESQCPLKWFLPLGGGQLPIYSETPSDLWEGERHVGVWPPQLNLRAWQAGKSNVFPLHCSFRFGFNTCTSQAMPQEERGHSSLKPKISSCCCAGFMVGTTGFGASCVLQVAGLMWHLPPGQSPSWSQ